MWYRRWPGFDSLETNFFYIGMEQGLSIRLKHRDQDIPLCTYSATIRNNREMVCLDVNI